MPAVQLIVGLANPGKEYAHTRHNAGAWFVETIANLARADLRMNNKYHGRYAQVLIDGEPCHLLIPTTFMNHSGRSVKACLSYHNINPENTLIAHDEIDLPCGNIKLKFDGGDGGHNGVKDVIAQLSTKAFYRLRIGVGHPGNSKEVVDYVLKAPSKSDREKIASAIQEAETVLPLILKGEMQKAMMHLHTQNS